MRFRLTFKSLKETRPREYVWRFIFGGLATVLAGLVADRYGPVLGGIFLAFPGIFPAGISLVENHKLQREAAEHKQGTRSARGEASVEAAGASAGAIGLIGFAAVMWHGVELHGLVLTLLIAGTVWMLVSALCWWIRERM